MPDAPELVAAPAPAAAARADYPPVVWLNLLCLDAPLVAVAWQWLFARTFGADLDFSLRLLLFFTAWLIYLADRFADTIKLPPASPISLRHRFCREHMIGWWIAIVVIFVIDISLALRTLDLQMFLLGGTLAAICGLYLFVNHSLGGKWRPIPMKEKAIGILFAAGTTLGVVGELPGLTISFGVAVLLFAILCTFNCLSIAAWERELDTAQGKTSFMTGWPMAARALKTIGYGIALFALGCAVFWRFAWPLWLCLAASALLLVRLNLAARLPRDNRTALADLVLLTPFLTLLFLLR
ncbi:MAG TPA: hypothetical protein VH207_00570 [Chthoniobacterales bacterium]|jgi:hypothetical protein|nr:hypothetical protein [Chthoniobacterales bacterium]